MLNVALRLIKFVLLGLTKVSILPIRSSTFHGYPFQLSGIFLKLFCIAFGEYSVNLQKFSDFSNTEKLMANPILSEWVKVAQKSCLMCKKLREEQKN